MTGFIHLRGQRIINAAAIAYVEHNDQDKSLTVYFCAPASDGPLRLVLDGEDAQTVWMQLQMS